MKLYIYLLSLIAILTTSCTTKDNVQTTSSNNSIEQKVDSIVNLMTVREKIGQMNQYASSWDLTGPPSSVGEKEKLNKIKNGDVGSMLNVLSVGSTRSAQKLVMENSRMKIPLIFGYDVIHGYKTIFPIPLAESASWDLEMIQKSAAIAAKEASAAGVQWTFAPMIDVSRDARWGRVMEGSGEDTYLTSVIGVARIKGFQGDDLSGSNTIAACAKHFAGYGFAESGKDYNTVNVGKYELHNVILPPFEAAAKAGVATFMNSFNEIDGIPSTGNKELQRTILKEEWNWDGFIVSDWGSIGEMVTHGFVKDKIQASKSAILAGSDMDMESHAYESSLEKLVKNGDVNEKLLDDAVKRILRIKYRLGLFDDPYRYCNEERENKDIYSKENLDISREMAKRSIVLLKNETKLLPLSKNNKKIAVIGPLANDKDTPLGNWRAQGKKNSAISLLEGITNAVGTSSNISFQKGCELTITNIKENQSQFLYPLSFNNSDTSDIHKAVEIAKNADIVFVALGEDAYQTGEGRSQTSIGFSGVQLQLLKSIYKVNKNIVLVLMNGRPMDISWADENIPTILECWHLGSQAGNAIADVVFGEYNPSGKLPSSFPLHVGQEPLYYNHKNTGRPSNGSGHVTFSGYTDSPNKPLYPFGYGLSYTTFEYKNLKLEKTSFSADESIEATVEVTNTGDYDGEEVVQLYIRDLFGSITRPVKELKGFDKIYLKKGETKVVTFKIDFDMLKFYTINNKWEVEPGDFNIWIGGSSDATLKQKFTIK